MESIMKPLDRQLCNKLDNMLNLIAVTKGDVRKKIFINLLYFIGLKIEKEGTKLSHNAAFAGSDTILTSIKPVSAVVV